MHRIKRFPWFLLVMFLCSLFIAWNVPYTHDDWDWGRQMGITNWLAGTFNNRYFGTFFVITMTRSQLFKTLVMSLAMTALPLVCTELAASPDTSAKTRSCLTAAAYLITFSMPIITWRQTYGWVAGFANFTLGALCMLSLLALLKRFLGSAPRSPGLLAVPCFLLGFAAQLFCEHISAFLPIFLGCAMVLTRCWKDRAVFIVFLSAFVGTLLGAFVIFFNPLYQDLATTGIADEQYRSLTFSPLNPIHKILRALISMLVGTILPSLYETHPALVLFLTAAAWIDLRPRSRALALALCLPMLVYSAACFYCAEQMRLNIDWVPASTALRAAGAATFSALLFASILCSPRRDKWRTLAFFLLGLALITPFAAISNMGPRCYHASHFCLLVAGSTCFAHMELSIPAKRLLYACLALAVALHVQAYAAIGSCSVLRGELTQQALMTGADRLVLPSVDGRYTYSWGYNPLNDLRAEHYREFYGLPADMELVFLPYGTAELWPEIPGELYAQAMIYP